jgi:UDP-N-acetylglucosamine 4,6-dehydratase/5-epimerase
MTDDFLEAYSGKVILVTGGTGSIGSEIVRQLLKFNPKQIRVFSRDESKHFFLENEIKATGTPIDVKFFIGDVRDKDRLEKAFRNVDIVFHAAALKHVPYCEYNSFEAIKTNVNGTQNVIDTALEYEVDKVIAISSDKAVNPNTIMGITKLLMERMIISSRHYIGPAPTKFSVVRFGNVLNSRGSVVPMWIEQIKKGGPVTVTDKKMKRFFMEIPDAVNLVLLTGTKMLGEEVFILKMPEVNVYSLAKETIRKYSRGKPVKIKIIGIRDREKIAERLFTQEEKKNCIDGGKYYIILPNQETYKARLKSY